MEQIICGGKPAALTTCWKAPSCLQMLQSPFLPVRGVKQAQIGDLQETFPDPSFLGNDTEGRRHIACSSAPTLLFTSFNKQIVFLQFWIFFFSVNQKEI